MGEPVLFPQVQKTFGYSVLLAGLATTIAALLAVFAMNRGGFSAMGLYLDFVIPAGAILVGVLAGSGYALASWVSGIRITRSLCVVIVLLQLGSYAAAEYIDYRQKAPTYQDGRSVSFAKWFDFTTRSIAFEDRMARPGEPLGAIGYLVRLLEALGFGLGGLGGALILRAKPYCPACQVYMSETPLAVLPAAMKERTFGKKDRDAAIAYQREHMKAETHAHQSLEQLLQMAAEGRVDEFRSTITELHQGRKKAIKIWRRIRVVFVRCKRCHTGHLRATLFEQLTQRSSRSQKLGEWALPQEFIQRYQQRT